MTCFQAWRNKDCTFWNLLIFSWRDHHNMQRRVEEIFLIFKNLHHLLNSLRPHQARVTLIHILELQIKRRKQVVEDIKRYVLNNY
ncbi:putative transcription regulator MED7 family [Rosa chinensis]|uniref:Mediator of RNA polymerase II transcription subunit 7 n=1 Tax=Rosa chinensis TaxID=74649 RepID=A0A2P6RD77_ROSCH|nr:putative transcription regulator MED7 family [Rosa chinensis]